MQHGNTSKKHKERAARAEATDWLKKLYDGNLWPMGVVVRPLKFKHRS